MGQVMVQDQCMVQCMVQCMDPLMVLPSLSMEDHTMIVTMMTRISLILHCQDLIMETGDSILEITDLSETIMRDIETDMITNPKTGE